MKRLFASLAAFGVVAGLAAPAAARPMTAFVKAGVTAESASTDYNACYEGFRNPAKLPAGAAPSSYPSVAAAAGAAAATGFMQGYMEMKQRLSFVDTCMAGLGYQKVEMTPAEMKALKAARGKEARKVWTDAFYARKGAELAAAATAPAPVAAPTN